MRLVGCGTTFSVASWRGQAGQRDLRHGGRSGGAHHLHVRVAHTQGQLRRLRPAGNERERRGCCQVAEHKAQVATEHHAASQILCACAARPAACRKERRLGRASANCDPQQAIQRRKADGQRRSGLRVVLDARECAQDS